MECPRPQPGQSLKKNVFHGQRENSDSDPLIKNKLTNALNQITGSKYFLTKAAIYFNYEVTRTKDIAVVLPERSNNRQTGIYCR
jgi:hypothetical protein